MTGARETIAVVTTFRVANRNSLERQASAYQPSRKIITLYLVYSAFIDKPASLLTTTEPVLLYCVNGFVA
jgi:hypothetical protein